MGEQPGVGVRDVEVVVLDGDRRQQLVDELLALPAPPPICQFDSDEELRCSDGRDCDVVVVADQLVQRPALTLRLDENRRVEDQSFQRLSSICVIVRIRRISISQSLSRGARRRRSLTARPTPAAAGSIRATTRPWRTIRNRSPPSTASRTSDNRRTVSVALKLFTRSDY